MSNRRYNASRNYVTPQVISGYDEIPVEDSDQVVRVPIVRAHPGLAVAPGGYWDFSDEAIAEGLASGVEWTDVNLRSGLDAEIAWKAERDAQVDTKPPVKPRKGTDKSADAPEGNDAANSDSESLPTDPPAGAGAA